MSYLQVKTILEIECVAKGDDNQIDLQLDVESYLTSKTG